jgi:HEAT repeat protein
MKNEAFMGNTWVMLGVMVLMVAVIARAENLESTYAKLQGAKPDAIIAALECGDAYTRELALAQIARENRSPELTRAAADAVATVRQPAVKAQLIAVLAERGDASVAPVVRKALTDADPAVRAAAVEACGLLKDGKAADALFGMLGGEQGEAAREALRRIPSKAIDARLVSLLRKGKGAQRVTAVELLAARRHEGLFPLLLDKRLFEAGDALLSKAVAGAIRTYAPADGFEKILAFMLSLPEPSANLLAGALAVTLGEAADKPACERAIEKSLATCDAAHTAVLTGLLAASQGADALRVLSERLESGDLEVRKEAIRSLGKWSGEAALVPLVLAAKRERDAGAQTLAWRAVIEIAGRSDKIVDFYQPVSAIHQAVWYAPRREEKVAALWVLPRYHPKSWEVEWLLTKVETEQPEMAEEARRVKNALVPPFSGWLGS